MDEVLTKQPLLPNDDTKHGSPNKIFCSLSGVAKLALKYLMWGIFLTWVLLIFAKACDALGWVFTKLYDATDGTIFGRTGSVFILFTAPILFIAILAYVYISVFPRDNYEKKAIKFAKFELWTFPVLVDGPFGVVTAAEFIGIIFFVSYILWATSLSIPQTLDVLTFLPSPAGFMGYQVMELVGVQFATVATFCLSFLFIPVARGSVLLRLIDIPFEHATRYHVWIGHVVMVLFTLHGLTVAMNRAYEGKLSELLEWGGVRGVSTFSGVISLTSGLLIWITSLHQVRKKCFELFLYTHQLYIVFVIFMALHVGERVFCYAAGGVFIFIVDRALRFWQSRGEVGVVSASCLPCGTLQLVFSKPPNLRYNPLSFIFVQVRELSWLQWHPFSVSSSPLEGENHISVLIKVLGGWTDKLRNNVHAIEENHQGNSHYQNAKITASVEGPYGHELPYHLKYENLILVAGGIGITPFLAILSDVFHRIEKKKSCLPKNILVVWSVKKSKELSLISTIDAQSISPLLAEKLQLDVQAYVTQESQPSLEDGNHPTKTTNYSSIPRCGSNKTMSSLVGTGNNTMIATYFTISTIGFFILYTLASYFQPQNQPTWLRGSLFLSCMVGSVLVFGGLFVLVWNHIEKRKNTSDNLKENLALGVEESLQDDGGVMNFVELMDTQYGCRPNFQAIFDNFGQQIGNENIGVIVCGPTSLQASVARECRSQSLRSKRNKPIFHFHSHSFDL